MEVEVVLVMLVAVVVVVQKSELCAAFLAHDCSQALPLNLLAVAAAVLLLVAVRSHQLYRFRTSKLLVKTPLIGRRVVSRQHKLASSYSSSPSSSFASFYSSV